MRYAVTESRGVSILARKQNDDNVAPFVHFAKAAARQALAYARLNPNAMSDSDRERMGVCIGAGMGSVQEVALIHNEKACFFVCLTHSGR